MIWKHRHTIQAIRQGKLDHATALSDPNLTEEEKEMLLAVAPCKHEHLEDYVCPAGRKYLRCTDCLLTSDTPSTFIKLGGNIG